MGLYSTKLIPFEKRGAIAFEGKNKRIYDCWSMPEMVKMANGAIPLGMQNYSWKDIKLSIWFSYKSKDTKSDECPAGLQFNIYAGKGNKNGRETFWKWAKDCFLSTINNAMGFAGTEKKRWIEWSEQDGATIDKVVELVIPALEKRIEELKGYPAP